MMLSLPAGLMGPSAGVGAGAGATATATGETLESGGASGGSSEVGGPSPTIAPAGGGGVIEESDRSGGGGNRWPRQETLALLKIRSDMGAVFRDANLKGPLWEDVSRKMAELGFQRSAKKCKEKFENVYKYHKRTKDGRAAKPDSKSYRFFDQLEAFETTAAAAVQIPATVTVSASTSPTPLSMVPPMTNFPYQFKQSQTPPPPPPAAAAPSSSTSSDECVRRGRKRKWKDYFGRLMREVVERQEQLQSKLLEALERAERARTAREEAWRAQETARIRRERDLLLRERSTAEAKDAAVIAFLKKMTNEPPPPLPPPAPQAAATGGGGDGFGQAGTSRWPKAEVEALIRLRTNMENKYQENGPKGPLWEEISAAMGRMGFGRNPKRCKEKWENINKYYKKVKESNRKRPEDSKTCPYFQLLEEIYREKAVQFGFGPKPDDPPIMARPEQQWPSAENDEGDDYEEEEEDEMMPNRPPAVAAE